MKLLNFFRRFRREQPTAEKNFHFELKAASALSLKGTSGVVRNGKHMYDSQNFEGKVGLFSIAFLKSVAAVTAPSSRCK